ncbi:YopX family protein [Bacillus mycoides]|uniref:YopX family protein n=1 Tax=Bacillus mycoides TaxID=1405 RepID=UPI001C013E93|nr:YopX family protein [Bacillus mycoides]QWH09510.1 hypothetical protein EXW49_27570 [Bacillus mycoides]
MREIKFRIFDKNIPRDLTEVDLHIVSGEIVDWDYIKQTSYLADALNGKYPIMQYTGLKAKNGKEIYEGDIVHMYSVMPGCDIDEIGIVKFIECAFLFEKTDGSDGWSIFNEATEIEVIGNIFENPELLKN